MNKPATNHFGGLAIGLQLHLQTKREVLPRHSVPAPGRGIGLPPLLAVTLESETDGILIVDRTGKVICYNSRFIALWDIPLELVERGSYLEVATFAATRSCHPEQFLEREITTPWHTEGYDAVFLKDSRVLERQLHPQFLGGQCVGRIITFREITARSQMNPPRSMTTANPTPTTSSALGTPSTLDVVRAITEPAQYVSDNLSFLQNAFRALQAMVEIFPELLQAAKAGVIPPDLIARAEGTLNVDDLNYFRENIPAALRDTATGITQVLDQLRAFTEAAVPKGPTKAATDPQSVSPPTQSPT